MKTSKGFTDEERAAIKERARELKAEERANRDRAARVREVLAKIATMPEPDRGMAERLHAIVTATNSRLAENLVRDARPCPGRQGRLLLPERGQVQVEVRNARLQ